MYKKCPVSTAEFGQGGTCLFLIVSCLVMQIETGLFETGFETRFDLPMDVFQYRILATFFRFT